jgi:hypothetical protein
MRKDERKASEPKGVYRVRNWREYNTGLIARGDVTMWIDEGELTQAAEAGPSRRGRPCVYSDAVIQMLLGPKQVYRLPLRALQGFAQSLCKLAFADLPVPNYSTLSRRAQELNVVLPALHSREPLHLVVDSTGLKLYGEGEWKIRKHGYSKRRTWRKVHLAMDANTGQVCAALMTHQDVDDAGVLPDLLDQIPADVPIESLAATARTTRSSVMPRLLREGPNRRSRRAKAQRHGRRTRPAQARAMTPSRRLRKAAGANGSSAATIIGARWSRT